MKVFPPIGIKDIVCISLGGDNLKLAYGRISPTRKEILDLVSYEIQGLSDEEITKSINASFRSLKLVSPEVIIVIPSHSTIAKNIEIPSLNEQEIKEIVDLQAGRHTPYAREEIIIDYVNIGAYRENYTKILLIIVTLSVVRRQIDILEKIDLKIDKVFFIPEQITRFCAASLKLAQGKAVQTLLHVDANFTDFINFHKGEIIFVRSIPIGRHHLMSEPDRYQMRFVEEVKKSMETYQSEDIGPIPEEILLTGSEQEGGELQKLLEQMLFIPIKHFAYLDFASLSSQELRKSLTASEDSFLDVIAPLLNSGRSGVNLLPDEVKLRKRFEEKSKDLVSSGMHVMLILALLCVSLISNIFFKSMYLQNLNERYEPVIEASERLDKSFSQIRSVKHRLKDRHYAIEVLSELYRLVPNDVQLSGIKFTLEGRFSIEGNSRTMGTVFSFIGDMEESGYFTKVESRRTTKRREGDEEIVDFEIICTLENSPGTAAS